MIAEEESARARQKEKGVFFEDGKEGMRREEGRVTHTRVFALLVRVDEYPSTNCRFAREDTCSQGSRGHAQIRRVACSRKMKKKKS
jgi:hypothetical protein